MPNKVLQYTAGIVAGGVACGVWKTVPAIQVLDNKITEHYHWGWASILLGASVPKIGNYAYGFGSALIIGEAVDEYPFGIGKPPEEVRGNLFATLILSGLTLTVLAGKIK